MLPLSQDWRLCVAPMLDLTDKHCRHFHRLLTKRARLYTEMVTTGALLHGEVRRHLRHDEDERPLALQLGGSVPFFLLDYLGCCLFYIKYLCIKKICL